MAAAPSEVRNGAWWSDVWLQRGILKSSASFVIVQGVCAGSHSSCFWRVYYLM
jgi:hypothetical protein